MKRWGNYAIVEKKEDLVKRGNWKYLDTIYVSVLEEDIEIPMYLKKYDTPTGFQWEKTTKETVVNAWKKMFEEEKKFFEELLKGVDN